MTGTWQLAGAAMVSFAASACGLLYDYADLQPAPTHQGGQAGSTTGSGADCPGACFDPDAGVCKSGTEVGACGSDSFACKDCVDDDNPCTTHACVTGACETEAVDGGTCPGGQCIAGSCVPTDENCNNGIDDNGDMLADCADPICTNLGFTCVQSPTGWTGPAAHAIGATVPSCSGSYDVRLASGGTAVVAAAASCPGCTCGSGCEGANVELFPVGVQSPSELCVDMTNCNGPTVTISPGTCSAFPLCDTWSAGQWGVQGATVLTAPTCTPVEQGSKMVPPATWDPQAIACGAMPGAGCTGSEVCAPPPPQGLAPELCVYREGDVACPAGYTDRSVFHRVIDDTRDCTSCSCNDAPGGCTGSLDVFLGDATCTQTPTASYPVPSSGCATLVTSTFTLSYMALELDGCEEVLPAPTGSAMGAMPVTLCCKP